MSASPEEMARRVANPNYGACRRARPGCGELGPWRPFYSGYVCDECLEADSRDVRAHVNPPGNGGIGKLFQEGDP